MSRQFTREDVEMVATTRKDVQYYQSLEKCKQNSQGSGILPEYVKLKTDNIKCGQEYGTTKTLDVNHFGNHFDKV